MKKIILFTVFVFSLGLQTAYSGAYWNIKSSMTPYEYAQHTNVNIVKGLSVQQYSINYSSFKNKAVYFNFQVQYTVFFISPTLRLIDNPDINNIFSPLSLGMGGDLGLGLGYNIISSRKGFNISGNTGIYGGMHFDANGNVDHDISAFGISTQITPTWKFNSDFGLGLLLELRYNLPIAHLLWGQATDRVQFLIGLSIGLY